MQSLIRASSGFYTYLRSGVRRIAEKTLYLVIGETYLNASEEEEDKQSTKFSSRHGSSLQMLTSRY